MTRSLSRREAGALTLVTALTGGAAAAQTGYAQPGYGQSPYAPPARRRDREMMALNAGDQRYVTDTMRVGGVALRGSRLAQSRSGSPLVRAFAEMEVREQTGIAQVLGEISGMQGPPPPPDARMAAMEAQLARDRGSAFDSLYGQGQIEGHQQLLRIQEDYLRGGRNTHLRHVATLARGQILDHLTLLRDGPRLLGR